MPASNDARDRPAMTRIENAAPVDTTDSAPRYELRARWYGPADDEHAVRQMPAATPHVTAPAHVGGLAGRKLELVEHSVLKQPAGSGVKAREDRLTSKPRAAARLPQTARKGP